MLHPRWRTLVHVPTEYQCYGSLTVGDCLSATVHFVWAAATCASESVQHSLSYPGTGQISTSMVCAPFFMPASASHLAGHSAGSCGQEAHSPRRHSHSHRYRCHSHCRGDRDNYGRSRPNHRQHQHLCLCPEQPQDCYTGAYPLAKIPATAC